MLSLPSMFDAPRGPPSTGSMLEQKYVQPNLGHGLRIWWAFWWPTTLASMVLTIGTNIALKRIYEETMVPGRIIRPLIRFDGYFFTYAVALFVMAYILRKNFRDFRIVLLPRHGESAQSLPPTFWRTVRVWWTYLWRTILYFAIAWVVVILPLSWFFGVFNPRPLLASVFFSVVGFIVGGATGLFAIYSNILDEEIGDFRVCLSRREQPALAQANPAPSSTGN